MALHQEATGPEAARACRSAPSFWRRASQNLNQDAVRALNLQIRRLAELLPGGLEHAYGFSCECGCGEIVRLSATEFDHQGGAWLDGHKGVEESEQPLP